MLRPDYWLIIETLTDSTIGAQNLRICTRSQNGAHLQLNDNAFGIKGMQYRGGPRPWVGVVMKDRRNYYTACCATPEEASAAYDVLATSIHGEFAVTNVALAKKKFSPVDCEVPNQGASQ